jgi:hypothetical protein
MESPLRKKMKEIFFGDIPPYYEMQLQKLERGELLLPMKSQNITSIEDINFTQYYFDLSKSIPPDVIEYLDNLSENERLKLVEANRMYIVSNYLMDIDNPSLAIEYKLQITKALLKFIQRTSSLSSRHVMNDQEGFMQELKENRKKFKKLLKKSKVKTTPNTSGRLEKEVDTTIIVSFALIPIWKHGIDSLTSLSNELYENGYTDNGEAFKNLFNKNFNGTCNWLKRRTTLLFLLGYLTSKNDNIPDVILDLVCNKVLFKGKPTNRHTLKTQVAKIKDLFDLPPNKLTEQYSEIYHIHNRFF